MSTIPVMVVGARGRMGCAVIDALAGVDDLELCSAIDLGDDLDAALAGDGARVVVDFSVPDAINAHFGRYIDAGIHPVVGTTGLTQATLDDARERCRERRLGGVVAPNFSIGAVLMMALSARAARHLPNVEIVEAHHAAKLDAPSGTALTTRDRIAAVTGADVPTHSVRLDGFLATQEVILAETGERLTIRHDAIDRRCYMPGVLLAVRAAPKLDELVVGLEVLLDLDRRE